MRKLKLHYETVLPNHVAFVPMFSFVHLYAEDDAELVKEGEIEIQKLQEISYETSEVPRDQLKPSTVHFWLMENAGFSID